MMFPDYASVVEKLDAGQLYDFPGGVHPDDRKTLTSEAAIVRPPLPPELVLPVRQHIGTEGRLCVAVGDTVKKGQPLTSSAHPFAIPVHAPTSGTIKTIGPHVTAHPSGLTEQAITLVPDGDDSWGDLHPLADYRDQPVAKVVETLCDAGISGMGGAGFPTHIKAGGNKDIEFIIINGAECEPYITADDRLMREHAWQIRQGVDVLCHLVNPAMVIVAIEDNKPKALEAMQIACQENPDIRVMAVPTKYPAGGEKQLIQVVTGREVPRDGLPADVGILMFNVGTCYAIADAIFHGKPLIERVVTVTGQAVTRPGNAMALLGTPVNHLLGWAGYDGSRQATPQVIMGGPMMGFTLNDAAVPVVKITNCLLVPAKDELTDGDNERACIRCSACADACPATLLPQQLYWHAKAQEFDKTEEYNLFDCIECGACAYVCPSEIPLVHYYRQAKSSIRQQRDEKAKAEKAKERFEARKARLEREKIEREEKHRKAKEARAQSAAPAASSSGSKDKVAAALARAKAKKAQAESGTAAESQTPATDAKSRAAAAVARAKAKKAAQANASDATSPETNTENSTETQSDAPATDAKSRAAAAVARAKAKKAAREQEAAQAASPSPASDTSETSEKPDSAAVAKQQRVAAAVAKAKAKKAAREQAPEEQHTVAADTPEDSAAPSKQQRIAAAVAKAKAKKAAREQEPAEQPTEAADTPEDSAASSKQQRIAAAVAKAKAKKAAREQAPEEQQTEAADTPEDSAASSKQQRIAAAVAKAKAKKAAREQQDENNS